MSEVTHTYTPNQRWARKHRLPTDQCVQIETLRQLCRITIWQSIQAGLLGCILVTLIGLAAK